MNDSNTQPRILHKRKKEFVPLSKLGMSDAVKVVSDSPKRLEELMSLLEDRDRKNRDRAAATLFRLASLNPSRLLCHLPRLQEALLDESAYVRWFIACTVGMLGSRYPRNIRNILPDLAVCLQDQNRIVRILAAKALAQVAVRDPENVANLFRSGDTEMPSVVAGVLLKKAGSGKSRPEDSE
jgi:hypothetical protein